MFTQLDSVVKRFEELTEKMADPTLYDRQTEFKEVSEERANIEELVQVYTHYKKVKSDLDGAKELLASESDEEMREMAKRKSLNMSLKFQVLKRGLNYYFFLKIRWIIKTVWLKFAPELVGMRPVFLFKMFGECIQTIGKN